MSKSFVQGWSWVFQRVGLHCLWILVFLGRLQMVIQTLLLSPLRFTSLLDIVKLWNDGVDVVHGGSRLLLLLLHLLPLHLQIQLWFSLWINVHPWNPVNLVILVFIQPYGWRTLVGYAIGVSWDVLYWSAAWIAIRLLLCTSSSSRRVALMCYLLLISLPLIILLWIVLLNLWSHRVPRISPHILIGLLIPHLFLYLKQ